MRLLRRADPLVAVALVLFAAAAATSLAGAGASPSPLGGARSASVYDDGPGGASVLRRFLADSGIAVTTLEGARFGTAGADVVFALGLTSELDAAAVAAYRAHLESGGTLVLATDLGLSERLLLDALGLRLGRAAEPGERALRGAYFLAPEARRVAIDRGVVWEPRADAEPLTQGPPVVVALGEGRGLVVAVGSLDPFLNATIGRGDNGRFALALARIGRSVAFDEHHHGVRPDPDQFAVLFRTWPGVALLAAGAATLLYLVLSGRRLGPPVPLDPRPPRSSLDYVRAFAGLVRRSGRGEIARRRLRDDLRRGLARRAGVDPATPLERLAGALDAERAAEARALDALLARPLPDDELLRTVARIDRLTAR